MGKRFLPTRYQGVKFRSVGDPVLYLSDPPGFVRDDRRVFLDTLSNLNQVNLDEFGDPEIATRISHMRCIPDANVGSRTDRYLQRASRTFDLYGEEAKTPGTFAANCLLARRLAERGSVSSSLSS